jgi:twitching motility two-component system response regulator PilH
MKRPRILVVDDQPHIARITRMMLDQAGKYDVSLETRPSHVVEAVRQFTPDAIVLDFNMPGKNGAEVAREIWKDDTLHETAILFFCGLVPPKDPRMQETARGPFRFVSKMIAPKELVAAIDEMVSISSKSGMASAS